MSPEVAYAADMVRLGLTVATFALLILLGLWAWFHRP